MTAAALLRADPLADDTIARILGPWDESSDNLRHWADIAVVNQQLAQWQTNGGLASWQPDASVPPHIADALRDYVAAGLALPAWADCAKIERAETLFFEMSMLSCTLLFCASLPQCYVYPDLAGVLHVAGQLEQHTDYRIRSTAAMIFPVMMKGGLTTPEGGGLAQILKVRLIHATIRNLMLRGAPHTAWDNGVVRAIPPLAPQGLGAHHAMYARGWDVDRYGLPCNQQELSYTLLTFNYVFLDGLRTLGIGLKPDDEEAYLHAWNVTGHVLGIGPDLMAHTMDEARTLFARLQDEGRASPYLPDPRPALAAALMQEMENELPLRVLKPFPVLLTRKLCGAQSARDLGIDGRVSLLSRVLFTLGLGLVRLVDGVARLFIPEFSLCRMVTRVVGYQFTVKVLMDQTRPLKLPETLLNQVSSVTRGWHQDPKAPGWVNKLEGRLTGRRLRAASQESRA